MSGQIELADVIRRYGGDFVKRYGRSLSPTQQRVLRDIAACRTAALGGHVSECDQCGHRKIAYNSCRNRHCPKCQGAARCEWMSQREAELLPVPYFHVVFTLPAELEQLALQNKRTVYGILFQAAAETLLEIAADPKHLGAKIGFLAVLHTWGQNLMHHPHVHCVVPAGGLAPEGDRWVGCKRSNKTKRLFFLPVRVLSRVFRGKFIAHLKDAYSTGRLVFHGRLKPLAHPANFARLLNSAVQQDWVVYAKRPFGGPQQVLKYLARYTHRVAISNQRLVGLEDGQVTFHWKDYADKGARKTMTLAATEFIRRFLMHVLPPGFQRIRYYGFMANRHRQEQLAVCRSLLGAADRKADSQPENKPPDASHEAEHCPVCHVGRLVTVELVPRPVPPWPRPPHFLAAARCNRLAWDTP